MIIDVEAEGLDRAIHLTTAAGMLGTAILLRAVRDGRIWLFSGGPPESAPKFKDWAAQTARQPAIALLGDDNGQQRGAAAWAGYAYRMMRWASFVIVHASGAELAHYQMAIAAAEVGARVLIVETCSASAPSWLAALDKLPPRKTLLILPREGSHPLAEAGRPH
jgi:hypothetical protein